MIKQSIFFLISTLQISIFHFMKIGENSQHIPANVLLEHI